MELSRAENLGEAELSDLLLGGASLNIYLEPDVAVQNREGEQRYLENYALPNLLVEEGRFFAFAAGDHFQGLVRAARLERSYFAYSNVCDLFMNFVPRAQENDVPVIDIQFMSMARYSAKYWVIKQDAELLFDSAAGLENKAAERMIRAIRDGADFRIALQDEAGVWHRHEVDLPFYWERDRLFQFQTRINWYPEFFRKPVQSEGELKSKGFPDHDAPDAGEFALRAHMAASCSYIRAFSDGRYRDARAVEEDRDIPYQRLLVFATRSGDQGRAP